jgi:hypothetical protein
MTVMSREKSYMDMCRLQNAIKQTEYRSMQNVGEITTLGVEQRCDDDDDDVSTTIDLLSFFRFALSTRIVLLAVLAMSLKTQQTLNVKL